MPSLLLLLSCGDPDPPPREPACEVTWDGFARPFLTTWCTPCHASTVVGDDRRGAPFGVDFDTWQGAAAWAPSIAAVAGSPGDPMPPAGGVPDADREALSEWVECGAPGPDVATPPDPCDGVPAVVTGDLVLTDAGADCVEQVAGSLYVADLAAVALARLERVDGTVTLAGDLPAEVAFPRLADAGALVLDGPSGVVELDLPRLTRVTGDLRIERAPALARIVHTSDLEEVGGDLVVRDNPALRLVDDFSNVVRIGGDFEIGGNGALVRTEGFWHLEEVGGDLRIEAEPVLTDLGAFETIRTVGGDVAIEDADALDDLDEIEDLEQIGGDLVIRGNASLDPAYVDLVAAALDPAVAGAIVLEDNG